MLHAFGVGEVPISISGDPTWPGPLVHTIRDVGNVTHALVTARGGHGGRACAGRTARAGEVAEAAGGDVVLAAGGIGLAPLRPALWEIADRRDDYGRVVLLYGARSPSDVLFAHGPAPLGRRVRHGRGDHRRLRAPDVARAGRSGHQVGQPRRLRPAAHDGA